jgi:sugar phosphate isomerase/epimerase
MSKPKIGLSMLYCLGEPFPKMLKQLQNAPTPYIEVVDDGYHTLSKQRVATLNQIAKKCSLQFTVHSPFADINIASPSKPMRKAAIKRLTQSIQYAADLNAKLWVLHPGAKSGISMFYPGQDWKQNVESIQTLTETAKKNGVTIAVENLPEKYGFLMKSASDFQRFYTDSGLETGIVLDFGHANLEGQIEGFLTKLPSKIVHIHVSDNHGETDQHLGLGYGKIDYKKIAAELKQTGFAGTIVIESVDHVQETLQKLKELFA